VSEVAVATLEGCVSLGICAVVVLSLSSVLVKLETSVPLTVTLANCDMVVAASVVMDCTSDSTTAGTPVIVTLRLVEVIAGFGLGVAGHCCGRICVM